ncbi:NADH-quinone oxidoreductase subunit NuoF [bacterium endosymbiont of Pedicinus badii]|uniref:NADH-quinone oxidoreductase subunit NuoF n=1 Tax=bacterium endosymbiont of Pedicinus badii TaxID=1719126 RepID=UPI0009BBDA20|nr:NADH-quinone oxidoreductase subunit NuoF [bacterium endosymbiont of Pedicinus badii]OQM34453.1 NADH dehydrogenase [bacterium endosymbiont of Pedicinus badii]
MYNKKEETHPITWRIKKDGDPVFITEYIKKNGYNSLKKVLKRFSFTDVLEIVIKSGLKGRGGAGFPTGIKWKFVASSKKEKRYLICNADEMEPGTYKDRFIMERIPHLLIEGMIISAYAIRASVGYIFLRGEYKNSEKILKKAIYEAEEKKLLGKNILNSDFDFSIFIHTGAGRYICGEETALINSLEGNRPNPRAKPPFPVEFGLWGNPTCVNNVETFCNIPYILLYGENWYKNLSFSKDSGTKLIGFSGNVNNPGLWEVPLGTPAVEILKNYAKGMKKGFFLKAWQPGGAGTSFLTKKHIEVPMDFDSLQNLGSRLGTGIAIVIDHTINMVSVTKNLEKFFSRESCGFCTPCRDGLPWTVKILDRLEKKQGKKKDIELLEEICHFLSPGSTFCAHAQGAASPLQSAIKYFREEFEMGIKKDKIITKFYNI